ncbi:L-rhamnose mutarotase [Pedobacter sp. MC2016-14]|uniref:L-rhamnose mutarotase n=1 Tax=Pedobacter sp. MC2016-14 TaxID=2897327 RepID=UPI001E5DA81F|nr:L-rhamnose mutarotase [Pedobacter sp. MC2016-14]MCD0488941.1 L-rhamnose mutarotase [Pedobacter sp. MC2016-14]
MIKYCLALDLVDDPKLIAEYVAYHKEVWPEIILSIKSAGIENMEIYRFKNRLMMVMEVSDSYDAAKKAAADFENEKVQEWERLMWKYQQAVPGAKAGDKWVMMEKIFEL